MAKRRLRRQARLQAQLRYGAEGSALRQMAREEDASLNAGLAFEAGAAAAIIAAALKSQKPVKRAYRESGRERDRSYREARTDLGGLSDAADPFRAGLAREFGLTKSLMARERAGAVREIGQEVRGAKAGQVYAQRNLQATRDANVDKIRLRQAELRREKGAFKASTYEDLLAAQREANRRAADSRSARADRRHDNRLAQERLELDRQREARQRAEANKPDRLSPSERRQRRQNGREWKAGLRETRTWYRRLQQGGNSLAQIRDLLTTGGKIPQEDGNDITVPKLAEYVPKVHREFKRKRRNSGVQGFLNNISDDLT